jgi:hypothetical protein
MALEIIRTAQIERSLAIRCTVAAEECPDAKGA